MGKLNSNRKVSYSSHRSRNSSGVVDSDSEARPRIKLILKVPDSRRDHSAGDRLKKKTAAREYHNEQDYTSDSSLSEGEAERYYKSAAYRELSSSPLSEATLANFAPPPEEHSRSSSKKKKKKSKGKKSKSKKSHRKDSKRDTEKEEDYSKYKIKLSHIKASKYVDDPLSSPLSSEPEAYSTFPQKAYIEKGARHISPVYGDYSSPLSDEPTITRENEYTNAPPKLMIRLPQPVDSAPSSPLTPEFWKNASPEPKCVPIRHDALERNSVPLSELSSPISPEMSCLDSPLISPNISDVSPKIEAKHEDTPSRTLFKLKTQEIEASDNSSLLPLSEHPSPINASSPVSSRPAGLSRLGSTPSEAQDDIVSVVTPLAKEELNPKALADSEAVAKPKAKRKRKSLFRLNPLKKPALARNEMNGDGSTPSKSIPKVMKELKGVVLKLLDTACKRDKYGVFLEPVDLRDVPDYHTVIKNPMDFGTMRNNVEKGKYKNLDAFLSDFRLVCTNAMTYNDPSTVYYKSANRILELGLAAAEKERNYIIPDSVVPVSEAEPEPTPKEEIVDVVGNPITSICPSPSVATPATEPSAPSTRSSAPIKKQPLLIKRVFGPRPRDGSHDPKLFQAHQHNALKIPKLEPAWISRKAPYIEGAEYPAGFLHFGAFPSLKAETAPAQKENSYLTFGDTTGVAYASSIASFVSGLGPEIQKLAVERLNHVSLHTYDLMKNTRKIITASLAEKNKARQS